MRLLCCLSVGWLFLSTSLLAAPPPNDFQRARPAIERKLRALIPMTRIEGLDELTRFRQPEAALLALSVTRDAAPAVRHAALRTLSQLADDAPVRAWMVKRLVHDTNEANAPLLAVLFAGDPQDVIEPLNKTFKASPAKLLPLLNLIDDFATWSDAFAVRALVGMTKLDAFSRTLGMRRCVVRALLMIRLNESVGALIGLLPKLEGELLFQVGDRLDQVTGEANGPNAEAWQLWWQQNKDAFRFPADNALPPPKKKAEEVGARYYGLPIQAKKVFFIIDISGSMAGPKLNNAKKELIQAIDKLPPDSQFNIMVFSSRVGVWSPKLVEATDEMKKKAKRYVSVQYAKGATHTYDALKAALDQRVEAIYILTDGEPTGGQIVAPDGILVAIRGYNRLLGSSIHTIGLGTGPDASIFSRFLSGLADQNFGRFRKLD